MYEERKMGRSLGKAYEWLGAGTRSAPERHLMPSRGSFLFQD